MEKIAIFFSEKGAGEGGGQGPFGNFPEIHPFWYTQASLSHILAPMFSVSHLQKFLIFAEQMMLGTTATFFLVSLVFPAAFSYRVATSEVVDFTLYHRNEHH